MYTTHFHLKENPFSLTPDPRYLFLSDPHREALNHLVYGICERKGFIVITGGIGTGKTTVCRALLNVLDPTIETALILNSYLTDLELLETIAEEFGIATTSPERTKKRYIDSLNEFLLKNFSSGGNAVILIDEAQNLSRTVLEQIRMLSNLETEREKLLQIILVGQPELDAVLSSDSLRQINERILVRYEIHPLAEEEVQKYIEHRIAVAGGNHHLDFAKGTFKTIYKYSRGNPRRINALCDRALLIAYGKNSFTIDKEMIKNASNDIKANYPGKRFSRFRP